MQSCFAGQTVFQSCNQVSRRCPQQPAYAALRRSEAPHRRAKPVRQSKVPALHVPNDQVAETDASIVDKQADFALLERAVSLSDAERPASAPAAKSGASEPEEQLTSTAGHRVIVGSAMLLLAGIASAGVSGIHSFSEAGEAVAAATAAYVLADFATGVYHWSVDNYGSGATPIVGDQIAAFQGHHQRPWTITQREFANNLHKVFKPTMPFSAAYLAANSAFHFSPTANCFIATFVFMVAMSQQFHAWGHMKKSDLPAAVLALQSAGLLISRKAHGAHHKAPFEGNYCIVSGLWNSALDQNGSDQGFFRKLEKLIAARTGVEPRCWYEPNYELEELPAKAQ